jgi:predicted transcriptional regulator
MILITLKDSSNEWHLSKIATATGTTYVYVTKLLSNLERRGLVSIEQKGKKRIVKLTEKGLMIANLMDELKQKLEDVVKLHPQSPQAQ